MPKKKTTTRTKKIVTNEVRAQTPEVVAEKQRLIQNGLTESILGFVPGGIGTQLDQVDTLFKNNRWYLVSNMRQLLSEMYTEHGIIKTAVGTPVDDAFRGGIKIKTSQLDEDELAELKSEMDSVDDMGKAALANKWNRLYGGGGILVMTGQDPETPLDLKKIGEGEEIEFRAVDMWELFWDKVNTSDRGANLDGNLLDAVEYYSYYGVRVHKSRVLILKGMEAPSFIRPRLRGWGLSIVETMVRSVNQYLKATGLIFEILDEFKIDVYKIKGLAEKLLTQGGVEAARERIRLANLEKNYLNAVTMDSEDDFSQKELNFAGIAETLIGIRMQVASDLRMPMTKLFGISASGFNAGEDDIENYNSMVESDVRTKSKPHLKTMVMIRCQQKFGFMPTDLEIEFEPLRIMSGEQQENVKTQKFNRVLAARTAGEISQKEFREAVNKDNLLPMKLDTSVADDELKPPEKPEDKTVSEQGLGGKSSQTPPSARNSIENDRLPGGKGDKLKPEDVDHEQLEMGIMIEMEHTTDWEIAMEIALDHLAEDPAYYTKLKSVENSKVQNPGKVDESLWTKAKSASQKAFGKVKWPFVTWWYKKHGGTFK